MGRGSSKKSKKAGASRHSGGFAGIPRVVLETKDFLGASLSAKTLLLCLACQYRGGNNGDLSLPHGLAKQWGVGSKSTLVKALRELEAANLILRTREGRFLNPGGCCALYALTWEPIDECKGKLDVSPTIKPIRQFSMERSISKKPGTVSGAGGYS